MKGTATRNRSGGYMLLEVIIALTVFAIAVVGMAEALNVSIDAMNYLNQQEVMRNRLNALLVEAKQKPKREEMIFTVEDPDSGIRYHTELEELKWVNRDKRPVTGLYALRAVAQYEVNRETRKEVVEVYVRR